MRKETINRFLFPLFSIFFLLVISGCQFDTDPIYTDPTYTVWTSTVSYYEFEEVFRNLEHGYYFTFEISNKEWDENYAPVLEPSSSLNLTEAQIKDWLMMCGFGSIESSRETSWIISVNHGSIVSRNGSYVYMIIK